MAFEYFDGWSDDIRGAHATLRSSAANEPDSTSNPGSTRVTAAENASTAAAQ